MRVTHFSFEFAKMLEHGFRQHRRGTHVTRGELHLTLLFFSDYLCSVDKSIWSEGVFLVFSRSVITAENEGVMLDS
jgi:hypothetical protein